MEGEEVGSKEEIPLPKREGSQLPKRDHQE